MRIALYQPEIAGNVGTIIRLSACFNVGLDIIEPCGFAFSNRALKRAGMDYTQGAELARHADWGSFTASKQNRVVLLTTKGDTALTDVSFEASDTLLFGQESAGVPDDIHQASDIRAMIPMAPGFRCLNVAVSAGIALHEALRQTGMLPR